MKYHKTARNLFPEYFFYQKLLQRDPKKRIGYDDENEIKNHPFFKDIDFDALYNKNI